MFWEEGGDRQFGGELTRDFRTGRGGYQLRFSSRFGSVASLSGQGLAGLVSASKKSFYLIIFLVVKLFYQNKERGRFLANTLFCRVVGKDSKDFMKMFQKDGECDTE